MKTWSEPSRDVVEYERMQVHCIQISSRRYFSEPLSTPPRCMNSPKLQSIRRWPVTPKFTKLSAPRPRGCIIIRYIIIPRVYIYIHVRTYTKLYVHMAYGYPVLDQSRGVLNPPTRPAGAPYTVPSHVLHRPRRDGSVPRQL